MLCPFCREKDTSVVDSRPTEDGTAIRRRTPAGKRRNEATVSGPAELTRGAIAAIAVPQRANGKTINNQYQITNMRSKGYLLFKIHRNMHKLNDLALATQIQKENCTHPY